MKSEAADTETKQNGNEHPEGHGAGVSEHAVKNAADCFRGGADKFTAEHFVNIKKHPAAHCCIKHHEQIIPGYSQITGDMPFGAGWLQNVKTPGSRFLTGAAYREFHNHNRQTENDKEYKIN